MNVRFAALSITLIASATTSVCPVFAGPQEGNARFQFAPNKFKLEQPRDFNDEYAASPKPMRPAMEGKVPRGLLGIDPQSQFLKPAPRPVASTQMQLRSPSVAPTSIKSPFSPTFGHPTAPQQPPIAALPKILPSFGSPSALPQNSAKEALNGKLTPHKPIVASRSVSGRLRAPKHGNGQAANPALALKPIETYGRNFFNPGAYLPSISASNGMSTKTNVSGTLLTKQKHH